VDLEYLQPPAVAGGTDEDEAVEATRAQDCRIEDVARCTCVEPTSRHRDETVLHFDQIERGRKQVEFELGLIELRESREEREHEVRERGRMTVGGEPGGEAQHAAAACRHTFL